MQTHLPSACTCSNQNSDALSINFNSNNHDVYINYITMGGAGSAQTHPNVSCVLLLVANIWYTLIEQPLNILHSDVSVIANYQCSHCVSYM